MNGAGIADAQLLELFPRFPGAVAGRDFEPGDQAQVNHLVVVRPVMAVNEHFMSAGGERDEVLVLDGQPAAIGHMDDKRAKGAGVDQFSNRVRLHVANHVRGSGPSKRKARRKS